jgi:hypothetical protein
VSSGLPLPFRPLRIACTLSMIVVAIYWQTTDYPFIALDDTVYVTGNRHVLAGLTPDGIGWAFTTVYAANWHPATWLSHMLDATLFGPDAGKQRLVNLLLHLANSLLLFGFLWRATGKWWRSGFVAALFAAHPMHVESVAWISERKDLLSTLFGFLTLHAYAGYVACRSARQYLLMISLFVLGLMSKPMLVTWPFVLLLLDYWPLARKDKRPLALVREKIPLFLLSFLSCLVTLYAQRHGGAVIPLGSIPWDIRAGNILASYVAYLEKTFWPAPLAVSYPYLEIGTWIAAGSALLLLGITALSIRWAARRPYLPAGWFWYLGTLVPVIGLVQVGGQAMADRYGYIPLTGIFIVIAWGACDALEGWRYRRPALAMAGACVVLALTITAHAQATHWRDSRALFEHAIEATPLNYKARADLGTVLMAEGKLPEAIAQYRESLRIMPASAETSVNLGLALLKQGENDEAIRLFLKALELEPANARARMLLGIATAPEP